MKNCRVSSLVLCLAGLVVTVLSLGCGGSSSSATPAGAIVGRADVYDYSPSVIQTGTLQQFWWCGEASNPTNPQQVSDTILYESIDQVTHKKYGPAVVLAETAGAWDSVYTCNPHVVRGVFTNPLGDGQTYTYAMYYVATALTTGLNNSIGAAFSNDGIHWVKYPQPVIESSSVTQYGVGQPVAFNADGRSAVTVYYEDDGGPTQHVEATSTDGVHFSVQGTLTANGLDPAVVPPTWGDMGYDPVTKYWYATFNLPWRPSGTTGGAVERGQYGIALYRIPASSLLTGTTPWQLLKIVDTNLTGNESNFLAGLLHDGYGNLNVGAYPQIQLYMSFVNGKPAWDALPETAGVQDDPSQWDVGLATWTPGEEQLTLQRYVNATASETTTGWIDPAAAFTLQKTLGHLYETPMAGATVAFYGCKRDAMDYFVSLDRVCEGQKVLGLDGYGYAAPVAGRQMVPLYRCAKGGNYHFLSADTACEGSGAGELLGYALP